MVVCLYICSFVVAMAKSRLSLTTVGEESNTSTEDVPQKSVSVMKQGPMLRFLSSVFSGFVDHFKDIKETTDVGLLWQPYHNSFN